MMIKIIACVSAMLLSTVFSVSVIADEEYKKEQEYIDKCVQLADENNIEDREKYISECVDNLVIKEQQQSGEKDS